MINVNLLYDVSSVGYWRRGAWSRSELERSRGISQTKRKRWARAGVGLWLLGLVIWLIPVLPQAMYALLPGPTEALAQKLGQTADVEKSQLGQVIYEEPVYVPPFDASLPTENRLVIEKIGFDSRIGEAPVEEVETVLKVGPWRSPDGGTPALWHAPMVVAAHRFGYLAWTNQYRRENSFFNLPKLENGDRIEVIWEQRKYTYEIYEGYTDNKLREESYKGDLILYTCEVLNSDKRIVRVARLVVDEVNQGLRSGFGRIVTQSNI